MPYSEQWNLSIERQFKGNTLLTVSYVGNEGHHLLANTPFNSANPQQCLALAAVNPGSCGPDNDNQTRPDRMEHRRHHPLCTGFPVTLSDPNDDLLLGTNPNGVNNNYVDLPSCAPGPLEINNNGRNGQPAFNTALFSEPAEGTLGNCPRRFFYGPRLAEKVELCKSARRRSTLLTTLSSTGTRTRAHRR